MINKCIYAEPLGCKTCEVSLYKQCKKFIVAHAKFLARDLGKFQYSSKFKLDDSVVWSKDINKSKSAALRYALQCNTSVKRYTLSQVISLTLTNEPIEAKVVYIEYQTKLSGDVDKLKGILVSFVDNILLHNGRVSIFVTPSISFNLEYTKL